MKRDRPALIAADLEGVFWPEIWIAVAEKLGIEQLRLTTRDISDYDELMQLRMQILRENGLRLADIQAIIAGMDPLPGAASFLAWLRNRAQLIILTDSFYQFVIPFLPKLNFPTVFAHQLHMDDKGELVGYQLRVDDSKRMAIESFRNLGFRTMSFGDSYNDTSMLAASDVGVLYRPPAIVVEQFPQFAVATDYDRLEELIATFLASELPEPI